MAASGVNIKMGVSGISQFKQNLTQAKSAVKTLDAQLALTEKQFKASGDAESYMTEKGELLKAKLEKQSQIVNSCQKALDEMTKNGVDRASKSYQDMYQQMINAKGAMLDTQTAMENIAGAAEDADVAVSGMDDGLRQIGTEISYQNITSALDSITGGMETVMKKAWEVGKAIVTNVLGAGNWADDLNTRATKYGLSPEELQRIDKTAALIDTSTESIVNAKKKMKNVIGNGSADTVDALDALGLGNVVETDPEEMFWKIGEAIMNLGDEYEQEAAAQKLFGKSWYELIPLFETGREEYEKLKASWSVVPQKSIDKLQEMDDKYQVLQANMETIRMEFMAELAPTITSVMGVLNGLLEQFNEYLQTEDGKEMMESLSEAVSSLFDDIKNIDPGEVMTTVKGIIDGVVDALKWISEHSGEVVTAVEAFIGVWAGLKTAKGVSTALQLINGIKGLAGAGASSAAASAAGSAGTAAGTSFATGFVNAFVSAAPVLAGILGVTAVAVTPAAIAQAELEKKTEQLYEERMKDAEKLEGADRTFMESSANALNMKKTADGSYYRNIFGQRWLGGNEGDIQSLLMGMNDRGAIEKAALARMLYGTYTSEGNDTWLELQRLWGGEEMDMGRMTSILEAVTDAYDRMAKETDNSGASTWLSAPIRNLSNMTDLPQKVKQAVETAIGSMSVYLDGQKVGELTAPYVSEELAGSVLND